MGRGCINEVKQTISEKELSNYLAVKHSIDSEKTLALVNDLFEIISNNVAEGKTVEIKRFGVWSTTFIKAGKIGNNAYKATATPNFASKQAFKEKVKGKFREHGNF